MQEGVCIEQDNTKIHYSNKNLKWKPICNSFKGCRSTDKKELVNCEKCISKLKVKTNEVVEWNNY